MPTIDYNQARHDLSQTCKRYLAHNKEKLDAVIPISPSFPEEFFFIRALGFAPGFLGWISCKYAEFMDNIKLLNLENPRINYNHYEQSFPECEEKNTFLPGSRYITDYNGNVTFNVYAKQGYVDPILVLDRLTVLVGLLHYIMVVENKELNFEENLQTYKLKNKAEYLCAETDPCSVKIYNTLKKLEGTVCFINDALLRYELKDTSYFIRKINESLPIFEGYIKGIAVQEIQSILDDTTLSAEDSLKAVASQLKNETTLEILGKNRQSHAEWILKVLSVALIAVGIGIIPTVILAAKRLYDTGGTSMNFFKPLSKNLCEDVEDITAQVDLDRQVI